jgi:hypothetical protein
MKAGAIVRIALIGLGIASAVLLAHSAFGIRFNEVFALFLDLVRDFIGVLVLPFELVIVKPVVRWLHELGLVFELREHWKNAFVLLWLFNASAMRAVAPLSLMLGGAGAGAAIRTPWHWAWAALAALLGGALAGAVPLDHPAVLWWPVAAFFLHLSVESFIFTFRVRRYAAVGALVLAFAATFAALALGWVEPPAIAGRPPLFWWPLVAVLVTLPGVGIILAAADRRIPTGDASFTLGLALGAALVFAPAAAALALALGVVPGPAWLGFERSPSPGLANLAAFVAALAAFSLLMAFLLPGMGDGSYLARVFNNFLARIALDVLAVLGGAALIVYLAHLFA